MDAEAKPPRKGFAGYEPGCEEAVYDFQRRCYPERVPESIVTKWSWAFLRSAERLGVDPMVWMYWKNGRIVAHQGALAVQLKAADQVFTSGWFVETMASEEVRGSPIGPMVVQKALADLPINLSLGQTEQMRELQYKLGWQRVGELNTYLFVCSLDMNLRGKLPPVAAEAAAFALGLRQLSRLKGHRKAAASFDTRVPTRLGPEHDDLWQRMSGGLSCAVVRDARYLNWKYIDRPGGNFTVLELSRGGRTEALAVTMLSGPTQSYPYARGFIVDLVVPLDDATLINSVLSRAIDALRERGAKTVTFYLAQPELERAVARFGFMYRGARHILLVSTKGAEPELAKRMTHHENWYLTMGDSDADAYPG